LATDAEEKNVRLGTAYQGRSIRKNPIKLKHREPIRMGREFSLKEGIKEKLGDLYKKLHNKDRDQS